MKKLYFLLGRTSSGKTSVAKKVVTKFQESGQSAGWMDTGTILRNSSGIVLERWGKSIAEFQKLGQKVPTGAVTPLLTRYFFEHFDGNPPDHLFLIGYPRNVQQVRGLRNLASTWNLSLGHDAFCASLSWEACERRFLAGQSGDRLDRNDNNSDAFRRRKLSDAASLWRVKKALKRYGHSVCNLSVSDQGPAHGTMLMALSIVEIIRARQAMS